MRNGDPTCGAVWERESCPCGLVDNPDASVVVLTDAGAAFLASHPGPVDTETLKRDCPPYLNWLADMGAVPAAERRDRGGDGAHGGISSRSKSASSPAVVSGAKYPQCGRIGVSVR